MALAAGELVLAVEHAIVLVAVGHDRHEHLLAALEQLDDGDVPNAATELMAGFGRRPLRIQRGQERLDRMEGDFHSAVPCIPSGGRTPSGSRSCA